MAMSKTKKTKPPPARKSAKRKTAPPPRAETLPEREETPLAPDDRIVSTNLSLHQLFEQQTARMLDRADLSEEQKQSILIGMSCPCCGAGGFSFTAKLKRG
jgi:hypothetical protein